MSEGQVVYDVKLEDARIQREKVQAALVKEARIMLCLGLLMLATAYVVCWFWLPIVIMKIVTLAAIIAGGGVLVSLSLETL